MEDTNLGRDIKNGIFSWDFALFIIKMKTKKITTMTISNRWAKALEDQIQRVAGICGYIKLSFPCESRFVKYPE